MLLFFLSNNLFSFHLLGNFLYVVCCILWETVADDVILDFLCAYLSLSKECIVVAVIFELVDALYVTNECQLFIIGLSHMKAGLKCKDFYLLNYLIFSAFLVLLSYFFQVSFLALFYAFHFPTQK